MSDTLAVPMSFEDKLKGRIRDSIGELMSDEDLKRVIERGIDDALFKPRLTPSGYGGHNTKPSLVEEAINTHFQAKVREALDDWIKANPEKLQEALDKAVKLGIAGCIDYALEQKFSYMFQAAASQMKANGALR